MNRDEPESTFKKVLGVVMIVIVLAAAGGVVGYASQSGLLDFIRSQHSEDIGTRQYYHEKAKEPITRAEFKRRTTLGWWIGYGIGAGIGVVRGTYLTVRPKKQ